MLAGDVAVAHMLADHGAVLRFHQPIVVAVPRPALGLLDQQLVQQTRDRLVDELATVVGMKAANAEGELAQQGFEHGFQPGFADALGGGHDLPWCDLIDGVDVIHPLSPDRPGAPCPPAESRAGLADRAAAARRWLPSWALFWCAANGVRDSAAGGADCTDEPPRCWPAAGIPACHTGDTRAPECAAWPVR